MKKLRIYLSLHIILLLYSLCSVCSKYAALQQFLSPKFFILYGLVIIILGIYAILWQQILKIFPLNVAFANKAVTILWGMLWGVLLFHETITPKMIMGALIVLVGVMMVVTNEDGVGE